jgi:hypothetical protein
LFHRLRAKGFDILALHHAEAMISRDMSAAENEIEEALLGIEIPIIEMVAGGGGEAGITQRLRRGLAEAGWLKRNISVRKIVRWGDEDEREVAALSHEIDRTPRKTSPFRPLRDSLYR